MPYPKLNRAQTEAVVREDALTDSTYPGEYVAFIDTFDGDELTRRVLAHAPDSEAFQDQMAAVDPELVARAEMFRTSEPSGAVRLPARAS